MKVYLAGGFHGQVNGIDWQEYIKDEFLSNKNFVFLNPKDKEKHRYGKNDELYDIFKNPMVFTTWDLNAIKASDYVFAYIDKGNPAIGVTAEIGYAVGLNKPVILVTDKEEEDSYHKDKYFNFLRCMPNLVSFYNIKEGITYLKESLVLCNG